MGFKNLEDMLNQKKQAEEDREVDWNKQKDVWLDAVKSFYEQIENLLTPLKDKDLLDLYYEQIYITEEHIGIYAIDKMVIKFPDHQTVSLVPVGTLIIAAFGRIDMEGPNGTVKFLWVPKSSEGPKVRVEIIDPKISASGLDQPKTTIIPPQEREWKIATAPPRIQYIPITEDSFSDELMGVMHGR